MYFDHIYPPWLLCKSSWVYSLLPLNWMSTYVHVFMCIHVCVYVCLYMYGICHWVQFLMPIYPGLHASKARPYQVSPSTWSPLVCISTQPLPQQALGDRQQALETCLEVSLRWQEDTPLCSHRRGGPEIKEAGAEYTGAAEHMAPQTATEDPSLCSHYFQGTPQKIWSKGSYVWQIVKHNLEVTLETWFGLLSR